MLKTHLFSRPYSTDYCFQSTSSEHCIRLPFTTLLRPCSRRTALWRFRKFRIIIIIIIMGTLAQAAGLTLH